MQHLKALRVLSLAGTSISDVGLSYLRGLTALDELELWQTRVTPRGIATLQHVLPECYVTHA